MEFGKQSDNHEDTGFKVAVGDDASTVDGAPGEASAESPKGTTPPVAEVTTAEAETKAEGEAHA